LKIGDPLNEETDIGSIINDSQFTKLAAMSKRG
jgi:hypothetical protein